LGIPIFLWCALLLAAIAFIPGLRSRAIRNDFAVYYVAALELRSGVDPYTTDFAELAREQGLKIREVSRSTEPPSFLLVFEPLTRFSPATAFWIWQTINLASLAGALVLLLRAGLGLSGPLVWTLAGLAFAYPAVLSHVWYGQSKLPPLLMMVVIARLMRRGFDGAAGLILAFAGLVRIYPFVIAGYFVLERRWRALAFMGVGMAFGVLATLALVGQSNCLSFVHGLSFYVTNGQWITNSLGVSKSGDNAPLAFAMRLLHETGVAQNGVSGAAEHALLGAIDIVLLGLTVHATLLHPVDDHCDLPLFSLWVVTAIVMPPVSWDYDMTLLLLPFACIAAGASQGTASPRTIAMAIASYVLIGVWGFSGIGDAQEATGVAANLLKETASLSLLAAYCATYWLAIDRPASNAIRLSALPARLIERLRLSGLERTMHTP
jgi:Glycosyltransferase family 87